YKTLLKHIMLKKKTVMLVAVGLLALAFVLAGQLDQELMSATGLDNMSISIEQRSGTRLEVMDENIQFIEQMIIDDPDFDGCNLTISGSTATITGFPSDTCDKSISQLVDEYNQKLMDSTNMSIIVSAAGSGMSSMMSVMSSTEVDMSGDSIDDLKIAARQVDAIMMEIPGVIKTSSNLTSDATQVKIQIDPLKCMNVGLTAVQVASEMYNASSGIDVMDMTIGTEEYSVRMEYPEDSYVSMNQLLNLEIATPMGSMITVSDVAEAVYMDVPNTLVREDGKYQVAITAYTTEAAKFTAQEAIVNAVNEAEQRGVFPEGVGQTQSMMNEMIAEEFTAIGKAIFTAVFLIFLVMAMQFESPVFSLMVMLSIPFSLIGSFFLLFISGSTLNMTSLMGVLMLVGIVVNNGILYVDTTNQLKETMSLNDALMESGRLRLRPILMTTLTTILSMIPMIFTTNENAAMMKGMSLIIIGGLITSTLLILLLLPSFYLLMSKQGRKEAKERKKMKRQKRLSAKNK
ncbi:MAG: efflux RND transporter permease subunit, partial [Lachnospiraceae bacterium]|nr:efflux RND transporter permease subunit [Lachnospiraceae bacterium]